jgi:hypothetical protein
MMEIRAIRKTDFHNVVEYPRSCHSRKDFIRRIETEEFFPIDIVELILIKEGFIERFEDFSAMESEDDLFDEKLAEYQMRLKFLELFNELLLHIFDEFENMIIIRSGGTVVSNEKGRRQEDDIKVKRIIGYDNKNKINLAYRKGYNSDLITFSNIRMRSDFAKDLDYKDFIKEQINLYYVKQELLNN